MRSVDFSPLFRSTVGFDRLSRLVESALSADESSVSYPPYNIETTGEDAYRITMAIAGFGPEDVEITAQANQLTIVGKSQPKDGEKGQYLYRGIAGRAFERRFQLADHIKVTGAELVNGLLHVELVREVPEVLKPRTIKIETKATPAAVEHKQAA
jgi:molecular chaperone IbpA